MSSLTIYFSDEMKNILTLERFSHKYNTYFGSLMYIQAYVTPIHCYYET